MSDLAVALGDFLARPEVTQSLATGALVAARVAPLAILAPVLGLRSAPALVRAGVVLGLTLALTPLAANAANHASVPPPGFLAFALLREALIGSIFAIVSSIPFHGLEAGGRLIDLYRGANLAEVIAPPTGERTSPLGDLAILAGVALFASLGGVRLLVGTFAEGLIDLPVGSSGIERTAFVDAARALTHACRFAAIVAAPASIAILAADVAFGLAARTVPRISVFFVAMPVRAMVGLLFAFTSIGLVLRQADELAVASIRLASRLVH